MKIKKNRNFTKLEKIESVKEKSDPYISKKKLIFFCFAFIGLVNNLGYALIITSAQQFSSKLNDDKLIAFYPLALIIFDSLTRFINSRFFITISYFKRILGLSIYLFFGYIFLFIVLSIIDNSENFNQKLVFFLTLIPAIIMGTGQAFGEATFLGYIRTFPKDYISGWSSGTGCAGIFGASLSFLFKLIKKKLDLKYLYLIISPITALFFFAFYTTFTIKKKIDYQNKLKIEKSIDSPKSININQKSENKNNDTTINTLEEDEFNNNEEITDVSKNEKMSLTNFFKGFNYGKRYILNMFIVYFLEYTVCYGFCERANYFGYINSKGMFFENAQYEAFLICYQLGVFISRSSLFIVKHLTFIEILNIFQFINFIFWMIEAIEGFISNQWFCFFSLILLGLCGGGVYVGCFYFILNNNKIPSEYKELCLNIGTIFVDSGVLLSSIVCIIIDNILKNKKEI